MAHYLHGLICVSRFDIPIQRVSGTFYLQAVSSRIFPERADKKLNLRRRYSLLVGTGKCIFCRRRRLWRGLRCLQIRPRHQLTGGKSLFRRRVGRLSFLTWRERRNQEQRASGGNFRHSAHKILHIEFSWRSAARNDDMVRVEPAGNSIAGPPKTCPGHGGASDDAVGGTQLQNPQ